MGCLAFLINAYSNGKPVNPVILLYLLNYDIILYVIMLIFI